MKCVTCNQKFAGRSNAKYCSARCRDRAKKRRLSGLPVSDKEIQKRKQLMRTPREPNIHLEKMLARAREELEEYQVAEREFETKVEQLTRAENALHEAGQAQQNLLNFLQQEVSKAKHSEQELRSENVELLEELERLKTKKTPQSPQVMDRDISGASEILTEMNAEMVVRYTELFNYTQDSFKRTRNTTAQDNLEKILGPKFVSTRKKFIKFMEQRTQNGN